MACWSFETVGLVRPRLHKPPRFGPHAIVDTLLIANWFLVACFNMVSELGFRWSLVGQVSAQVYSLASLLFVNFTYAELEMDLMSKS